MRPMRAGFLFAAGFSLVLSSPLVAQVAPTLTGEVGLFELRNADTTPPGRFSFSIFFSQSDRVAAPAFSPAFGALCAVRT